MSSIVAFLREGTVAKLKRVHLFELHDFRWFPSQLRDWVTLVLTALWTFQPPEVVFTVLPFLRGIIVPPFQIVVPVLKVAFERVKTKRVIDLCSGSGGPLIPIAQAFASKPVTATTEDASVTATSAVSSRSSGAGKRKGHDKTTKSGSADDTGITFTLTDLYPNVDGMTQAASKCSNVDFVDSPVDATNVPSTLTGFRTMFCSFHHMNTPEAKSIISDVIKTKEGIAIFELQERTLPAMLFILFFMWPMCLLATLLFIRPLSFRQIFFTFVIPVVPFILTFDGLVSCLRTYNDDEMTNIISEIPGSDAYFWEFGHDYSVFPFMRVGWMVGTPVESGTRQ